MRELMELTRAILARVDGDGLSTEVCEQIFVAPTRLSEDLQARLSAQADAPGRKSRTMVSGAGHDAMIMADFAPTGLLFVPSRDGISHTPEEWTDYDQLAPGIAVVLATTREMTKAKAMAE